MISLYIKIHNKTGMLYFGKTCRNPYKYGGSGLYWKRHLKNHGNSVTTLHVWKFENPEEAEQFAIKFSSDNDIVNSKYWANLCIENSKDGAPLGHEGHVFTEEELEKMSKSSLKMWSDPVFREKMRVAARKSYENGRVKSLPVWDDDRKREHSQKIKELHRAGKYSGVVGILKLPKTDSHRQKIAASLKGLPKSSAHNDSLSWSKIIKHNPSIQTMCKDYSELVRVVKDLIHNGKTVPEVCKLLSLSWSPVDRIKRKLTVDNNS